MNLNTVMLGVVLGLSGWTLNRVSSLSEQISAINERGNAQQRELIELRARLTVTDAQVQANALAIARMAK